MRVESAVVPMDYAVVSNDSETSEVVSCDSAAVEEVENSMSEVSPLGDKEDIESHTLGTICDVENKKGDVAEAIAPNGVTLELLIPCKAPGESFSLCCQTPRESIFDPFAPGPEDALCGAPKKKVIKGTSIFSRRQLNFESGDFPVKRLFYDSDDSEGEEDEFLQGIRKMFIDLIISNQALEATGGDQVDVIPPESCKTPDSQPLLTGVADTCPDAPMRAGQKVVKLSSSICRKLDFGSVSPKSLFVEDK